jgi:biofilm PGA synthesis N-glycosyltransferase PgaC
VTLRRRGPAAAGVAVALALAAAFYGHRLAGWRRHELLPHASGAGDALRVVVVGCVAYLLLVFAIDLALLLVSAFENAARARQSRAESYDVIANSRFTIPVSVIVPMHNEEVLAIPVVQALLALDYPELEVIVVNDGSTDGTLELLRGSFALEPFERFERRVLPTDDVHAVYRSAADGRLSVVDKVGGGSKAGALNCGVNFARFRYVLCVDGDTIYERDALLKSMRLVLRDPARIVGLTSQIVVASHPELPYEESGGLMGSTLLHNFQHLEYLRSFLNDRLAWSRMSFMLCASGAFALYRRDVIEEVGGFSPEFSCEDMEFTFRVHEHFLRLGRPYRIVAMPDPVGRTEGPNKVGSLVSQRARWQRVMLETTWRYRRMILNPRYKAFGLLGLPFCIVSEIVAPFVEVVALLTLAAAAALGAVNWVEYVLTLGVMSFANAALTVAAIRLEDVGTRSYRMRDLAGLILLSPLELLIYRPILFWAHLRGLVGFFRGEKRWHRFERNARPLAAAAGQAEAAHP